MLPTTILRRTISIIDEESDEPEQEALSRAVVGQFEQYIKLNKKIPPEVLVSVNQIEDPAKLTDTIASHLALKIAEKQELLESETVIERLERVYGFMEEQMKAIQKELGETDDSRDELVELEERIRKTKLSKEAREKADAELKKLRNMSQMSAEATVVRNYLDWLLAIPWKKRSRVKKDIRHADRRVSGSAEPPVEAEGADPLPRRPSGRRQDLAGQIHR